MSYNQNFYNNFHGNTFQNAPQFLPPPPPPPAFFMPPRGPNMQDANIVKQVESRLPRTQHSKPKSLISISTVRDEICSLILKLKKLKSTENKLTDNINNFSDDEWSSKMRDIEESKESINKILMNINNLNVEVLQKLITKRLAKRARLKRLRSERKKETNDWIKQMQEKSRKIDEKLQKIQDEISTAKQDEEAKCQADIVLKETLRKKHDAKKYIVKLDALIKLRKARMNTSKGRGESVSDVEADTFNNNIEKLKTLWTQRLSIYEKEETDLRTRLAEQSEEMQLPASETEREVLDNLAKWKDCLFGGELPQMDFGGDVERFISVRSQWDEFVSSEGSCMPIGWVPPFLQNLR